MVRQVTLGLGKGVAEIVRRIKGLAEARKVVVIGIAGGSGSGKGHTAYLVADQTDAKILSMDDYYRGAESVTDMNFDTPGALDLALLRTHIAILKKGSSIRKPIYDFKTHSRIGDEDYAPSSVMIIEGLFAIDSRIQDELDIRVFIEASEDLRLKRRMERDMVERHRTKESVLKQWKETVKPMHAIHVEPQKEQADIVIVND